MHCIQSWPFLWLKPWFFDFFNFLILESKNALFLSRIIIVKHILLADFAKNKNMEKFQIFDQNHGLTFLEKISRFFAFFDFLILVSKNTFFFLEYRQTHFSGCFIFANNKRWKSFIFLPKPWTNPFGKIPDFQFF